ncbi:glycosyltransferase family 39 protein [Candidatus Reidiella endopervernicosa]|uniref:Glycosyltransferase family 39 protein n=1 Tax=Candidatus Reidiella endopervernicosa TaxID=2738883 RepID=A0A6N0HZZ0_9GAMM|nr:glycosyltransferase family 39 protein [Candidatus Reidiella endopervernicosa]QKQ27879.1 glycosyltransferase family 39 protein [Candidatus Reidiella endopervernicosa]
MSTEPSPRWDSWGLFTRVVGLYLLLHIVLRMSLSSTMLIDDAEQALFIQSLAWGYGIGQPPLYTWLAWIFSMFFGPGLLALTMLKYTLLFATFGYLFAASRRLFNDDRLALLAPLSLLLISPFAWRAHEGFTHTMLLALACAASYHALLRLRDEDSARHYILFGMWLAVGALSKYSFPLFALPLIGAALLVAEYRQRLLDRRIFASIAIMVVLTLPHFSWLYENLDQLQRYYASTVQAQSELGWFEGIGSGLYNLGKASLYYLVPFVLIVPLLFPRALWPQGSSTNPEQRLLGWFLLIAYGFLLLHILGGATYFKARWMHPVLLLFPLWFFMRVEVAGVDRRALRAYGVIMVVLTLFVVAVRIAQMHLFPDYQRYERIQIPMVALSKQVLKSGFEKGTVVASNNFIAAHLLVQFTKARMISLNTPTSSQPTAGGATACWCGRIAAGAACRRRCATSSAVSWVSR